jgi:hypothetical protein
MPDSEARLQNRRRAVSVCEVSIACAERAIENGEFRMALVHAEKAERLALALEKRPYLRQTARALEVLDEPVRAATLFALAERLEKREAPPEWDGKALDGTLLIEERKQHLARPLHGARFIEEASRKARHCIVLAEKRLVPLFQRSFPRAEILAHGDGDKALIAQADAVAGYHTLTYRLGRDEATLRKSFRPLIVDPDAKSRLRAAYLAQGRPLIGISWSSTNDGKEIPSVADWSGFLASLDATFVSLQYGDVAVDVATLREASGHALIVDESVDALTDLDLYAAQVASCDAVVTISNTAAHMAGAVGVPTFLIYDNPLRLIWPVDSESIAWYPHMTVLRRKGREWSAVLADVRERLTPVLSGLA